jgi:hypothetical protein
MGTLIANHAARLQREQAKKDFGLALNVLLRTAPAVHGCQPFDILPTNCRFRLSMPRGTKLFSHGAKQSAMASDVLERQRGVDDSVESEWHATNIRR